MCQWYEDSISDPKYHLEVRNGPSQFSWHSPKTWDRRVPCRPQLIILILSFFTLDSWTCRKRWVSWSWHFVCSWNIPSSRWAQTILSSVHRHPQLQSNKFLKIKKCRNLTNPLHVMIPTSGTMKGTAVELYSKDMQDLMVAKLEVLKN